MIETFHQPTRHQSWPGRLLGVSTLGLTVLLGLSAWTVPVSAQSVRRVGTDQLVEASEQLRVLLAQDPLVAGDPIVIQVKHGRIQIEGRVRSRIVYDRVIALASSLRAPYRPWLTIDTRLQQRQSVYPRLLAGLSTFGPFREPPIPVPWVEPRVGYYADPFLDEPPLISYSPDFPILSAIRAPETPLATTPAPVPAPTAPPSEADADRSQIQIERNEDGSLTVRGRVGSMEERIQIGEALITIKGVPKVINLLEVDPRLEGDPESSTAPRNNQTPRQPLPLPVPPNDRTTAPEPDLDAPEPKLEAPEPPAAPEPIREPPVRARRKPVEPPLSPDARKIRQQLGDDDRLADLPIEVTSNDDRIELRGEVPSVVEAMWVYDLARREADATRIIDRLRFALPERGRRNPLRMEDPRSVQPFLQQQIARHLDGTADLLSVTMRGDQLELRIHLFREGDEERVRAILRTIAVLRGFELDPIFL